MLYATIERLPGYRVTQVLGLVRGNTIRAKHLGKDLMAALRTVVGGEIKEYTEMLTEARNEAMQRLELNARSLGADAVIGLRFATSQVLSGAAELLVYGTAVRLVPENVLPEESTLAAARVAELP